MNNMDRDTRNIFLHRSRNIYDGIVILLGPHSETARIWRINLPALITLKWSYPLDYDYDIYDSWMLVLELSCFGGDSLSPGTKLRCSAEFKR